MRRAGVLGINGRNALYTLRWNPRALLSAGGRQARDQAALRGRRASRCRGCSRPRTTTSSCGGLLGELERWDSFVLKPVRGAMGNGIVVVLGRRGDRFVRSGGREISREGFLYHAAGIISGLYSLAGHSDAAMVEERLEAHPALAGLCTDGVPDVRVIVYRGVPGDEHDAAPDAPVRGAARTSTRARSARASTSRRGRTHHAVVRGRTTRREPGQRRVGARRADPGLRPRARDRGARDRPDRPRLRRRRRGGRRAARPGDPRDERAPGPRDPARQPRGPAAPPRRGRRAARALAAAARSASQLGREIAERCRAREAA